MPNKPPSPKALEQARTRLDDALTTHPGDPTLLLLRGRADARVGRYAEAAEFFDRAAKGFRAIDDLVNEATARLDEASSRSRAGFDEEARTAYHLAIDVFTTISQPLGAAQGRLALARHELANRQFDTARIELERCLEPLALAEAYGDLGWACERLVDLTRRNEDVEVALNHARIAVEAAGKARERDVFGGRLAVLGALHRQANHPAKARSYLSKSLPYLRETGPRAMLLDALMELSELEAERERAERSRDYLEEALQVADRGATVVDRRRVRLKLATQLVEVIPTRARRLVDEVLSLMEDTDHRGDRAMWTQIASVQSRLGETQAARESLARGRPRPQQVD
ncbi:MAG: hypothetical protein AAGA48_37970 [Myxococcota bacterium]